MKKISIFFDTNEKIKQILDDYGVATTENFYNLSDLCASSADVYLVSSGTILSLSDEDLFIFLKNILTDKEKILIIGGWNDAILQIEKMFINRNFNNIFFPYRKQIYFMYIGLFENNFFIEHLSNYQFIKLGNSEDFYIGDHTVNNIIFKHHFKRKEKFLLTTILYKNRPHRHLLKNKINEYNLTDCYIGRILNQEQKNKDVLNDWVGYVNPALKSKKIPILNIISWDLYEQCCFEIVPETHWKNLTFPTEKIIKPIVAKMPFLALSNSCFYEHLKFLGFKTFDSLIDESFAYEKNIESRVDKLVLTAKNILNSGAIDFYNATTEICNYNYDHLFYLMGKETHFHDQTLIDFFIELQNK